jgi:hypothetical protein
MPPYLPRLPFPPWVPDLSDNETQFSSNVVNVIPRGDGWLPFLSFIAFTQTLPLPCRGFFFARNSDGSVSLFAGTADARLWLLNNSTLTWTDVTSHAVLTLNTLVGGSGYTGGPTFSATPTTGGTGTGLQLDITITAGVVTSAVITSGHAGGGYTVGDTITAPSLPGGTGFSIKVASVQSTYGPLANTANWDFDQFNNLVIAVQGNVNPQVFDLASPTAFHDLTPAGNPGGLAPQAAFVAVVNRFIALSGLTGFAYRIQWSDLDNPLTWTPGVGQADFQDLPDGGICKGVAGFDLFGVIFQSNVARLLTYAPGSPVVFTITKITGGDGNGIYADYGFVIDQDNVFWISQEGFKLLSPGGVPQPIGKEIVDRYFFSNVDASNLQLISPTTDPAASRLYIPFKSTTGQAGLFDTMLIYDWRLQRWSVCKFSGEWLSVVARPGLTLENMDAVTPGAVAITGAASNGGPNLIRLTVTSTAGMSTAAQQTVYGVWNVTQVTGTAPFLAAINNKQNTANSAWGQWPITIIDATHVDLVGSVFAGAYTSGGELGGNLELIPFSFDTVSTSTIPSLAGWDSNNKLGFFNGPTTEAVIETGEQGGNDKRLFVKGFRVITDAPAVFGSVSYRDNPQASYNYTAEVGIDQTGTCLVAGGGIDTRYSRIRIRIPAGTVWGYAMAVEPDGVPTGNY